jgi:hypothetical protein
VIRGFAPWNPTEASRTILYAVREILDTYSDQLPLTGRQIFYVLVGRFGYEKSEAAANRLYGVLGRARRAGMLPFDVIRDGGGSSSLPMTYDGEPGFWAEVRDSFEHFSVDRQSGQPVYVELFCESPGMMPQLVRQAFPYSVPVYGTRGFTGLGVVAEIAKRAIKRPVPTMLLQVGDYDPSGESIFESMAGDAREFVEQAVWELREKTFGTSELLEALGATPEDVERIDAADYESVPEIRPVRVALTREQVEEYDLPTAPPSSKDSRSKNWVGQTCQAEAMPPDLLAEVVREAIRAQFIDEVYRDARRAERRAKDAIREMLDSIDGKGPE